MTTLEDKAETPEVVALSIADADETAGRFELESLELDPADEVGTDQFPQYGDWLPVTRYIDGMEHGDMHLECPRGLAKELVAAEIEAGDVFAVTDSTKGLDGEWQVEVELDD